MPEFREHYFLPRKVIIAGARGERPKDVAKTDTGMEIASECPFCPGNEAKTPPEIERIEEAGKWVLRVFPNKFPAVALHGKARGFHEIVVETRSHGESFHNFSAAKITLLQQLLAKRYSVLLKKDGIQFVSVFKNSGIGSGASLQHEHSQLIALPFIPKNAKEEYASFEKFADREGECPLCKAISDEEEQKERMVFKGKHFATFTPYASRFNCELMIVPKEHKGSFTEFSSKEFEELAKILKKAVGALAGINAAYNIVFHNREKGKFHSYVEVLPRTAVWAGFEFSTGVTINSVAPEDAAIFYDEKRRQ